MARRYPIAKSLLKMKHEVTALKRLEKALMKEDFGYEAQFVMRKVRTPLEKHIKFIGI